jgi:hypothetical protein
MPEPALMNVNRMMGRMVFKWKNPGGRYIFFSMYQEGATRILFEGCDE